MQRHAIMISALFVAHAEVRGVQPSTVAVEERLHLIETWDSIDPHKLPLPESHRRALDESLAEYARDPEAAEPCDEVRDDLFPRR